MYVACISAGMVDQFAGNATRDSGRFRIRPGNCVVALNQIIYPAENIEIQEGALSEQTKAVDFESSV